MDGEQRCDRCCRTELAGHPRKQQEEKHDVRR
jgi:hypothetical protein